jgi:hypothetical protein
VEYAQTRMQARFGERPSESSWRRLEAVRGMPAFLEAARQAGLRRWVAGLDERSGSHGIEIALRERVRSAIREVVEWMPEEWRAAVMWTLRLVDLPALAHLARGHPPFPWMQEDPFLRRYAGGDADGRRAALGGDPELDFLAPALLGDAARAPAPGSVPGASAVRDAWLKRWRGLWPERGEEARASVARLLLCVERNLRAHSRSSLDERAAPIPIFEQQLRRLFRSSSLLPAAAFAYLAIAALDVQRLRRALLLRALFPEGAGPP